jgi:hypothetical protein
MNSSFKIIRNKTYEKYNKFLHFKLQLERTREPREVEKVPCYAANEYFRMPHNPRNINNSIKQEVL